MRYGTINSFMRLQPGRRPSLKAEIQKLTPEQLQAAWESLDSQARIEICRRLGVQYDAHLPDFELVRQMMLEG